MKTLLKNIVTAVLTFEARVLLRRMKPKIIGITGSVGKTTTKDAIYAILSKNVHARKSDKSYNSEIGVPLTVLGLPNAWSNPLDWLKNIIEGGITAFFTRDYPKWLILEMGVDHPGDMERLTSWVKPDIVVLTRFPDVPVHVELFETPEAVIKEKLVLLQALKKHGTLVYNNDDEKIRQAAAGILQRTLGFSRYSPSPFMVQSDEIAYDAGIPIGTKCVLHHGNDVTEIMALGVLGVQSTYHAAAAVAVASVLNIGTLEAAHALLSLVPPPGRMRIIPGIKGTILIDDTYNASPVATSQALSTLREAIAKRKIAVLGDMLELGRYSVKEHQSIGLQAAGCVDRLVTVGVRAREIAQAALSAGMKESNILQFEDSEAAGRELQSLIKEGDLVLIKGSQGMRMEKTVEELMADPARAGELLVRQDSAWKSR